MSDFHSIAMNATTRRKRTPRTLSARGAQPCMRPSIAGSGAALRSLRAAGHREDRAEHLGGAVGVDLQLARPRAARGDDLRLSRRVRERGAHRRLRARSAVLQLRASGEEAQEVAVDAVDEVARLPELRGPVA